MKITHRLFCVVLFILIYSTVLINGSTTFHNINGLRVGLRDNSQTIAFLAQQGDNSGFSFTPDDTTPVNRLAAGYHHLGDVTFRVRQQGSTGAFSSYSSANGGTSNAQTLNPPTTNVFAAADLTPVIASTPLHVVRYYSAATDGSNAIEVWFTITNPGNTSYELGSFGFSMVFNNYWTGLSLQTTAQKCSITDPYIGRDHGWVKVSPITGSGGVLLVTPLNQTSFEGWRVLSEDHTPRSATFEGFYEWMVYSEAWALNEWKANSNPWNTPTSALVKPGNSLTYGLRLSLVTQGVRGVDTALQSIGKAVVQGVPGYVISTDMTTAYAFIHPPQGKTVQSISVSPANALRFTSAGALTSGWYKYQVVGVATGRSRATITYSDNTVQTVHYFILPPLSQHVASFGAFTAKNHWYTDTSDPFARAYSFMNYDASVNEIIVQERRSYVAGLSDESGAGPGLGISILNQYQPVSSEIALIDQYINRTLWGQKRDGNGQMVAIQNPDYGIKRSMFYIGMPNYKYTVQGGWTRNDSQQVWRSYNYPHPTALYWSMYRLARNYPQIHFLYSSNWYLTQAANTILGMWKLAPGYAQFGLMVGSVHKHVIDDLQAENMTSLANQVTAVMKQRTDRWASLPFPFGSEFPFDTTGQEEVYEFTQYFQHYPQSNATLLAVLAYMPSVPMWAYHGSARRYWDFSINGKTVISPGIERALHHYGSGLNAIPVLSAFRANPDDLYLLQVGVGAITGVLTNIQLSSGWTSMAFHGDPSLLRHDAYCAEYGVAFFGHAQNAASFVVQHSIFGYIGYLCDVTESNSVINVVPRDTFHQRVYFASLGLYLTLETGTFSSLQLNPTQKTLTLNFVAPSGPLYQYLRLKVEIPTIPSKTVISRVRFTNPTVQPPIVRNAYQLDVTTTQAVLSFQ